MTTEEYYSNGKFLITGEYLVLKGARSLAFPLKLGQRMKIDYPETPPENLFWETYVKDQLWFQGVYNLQNLDILYTSDAGTALFIQKILLKAARLNKEILKKMSNASITNYLDFSPMYGLGSSSSLISNIAYWTKVDPFDLLWQTSGGSGYDIACARATGPICYTLSNDIPVYSPVNFDPSFSRNIYFVYLGHKVKSQSSIEEYKIKIELNSKRATEISAITENILRANSIQEFEELIVQHEKIISQILDRPTIKSQFFSDFQGCIKSMGSWGGDFIMATSSEERSKVESYFQEKGLPVVFGYKEIVL
jgi:mevalonate kinase